MSPHQAALILFFVGEATIIETKTGSQPDDHSNGDFSFTFYSPEGTCAIKTLDNLTKNDRELGAVDQFSGDMLEPCETFQPDSISSVKITHWKGDGWRGEYLKISYRKKSFSCNLGQMLENNSSITVPCSATEGNKVSRLSRVSQKQARKLSKS